MIEVLEGRFKAMHTDPEQVRKGTREIVLTVAAITMSLPIFHLTYLIGGLIGQSLL